METLGAYEIVGELGRGGMATVLKGYHRALNRYVAIKMIHQANASDEVSRTRFAREAQIVASLHHPNIVPIYDFSEYEGDPYLVMKFIDGCSLRAVLADGPIPIADVLKIMKPVASAIDYAHSKGILHRDIKPANILLDMDGTPYLSDFGLARLLEQGATTISANMLVGTPYYMSPEQGLGTTDLDKATDIYSLGVVLYELLVGRLPFVDGTPISIIHAHIYKPLPMPREINPEVPLEVEAVLMRALAKDADERYASATTMIEELSAALGGRSGSFALNAAAVHSFRDTLVKPRSELKSASLSKKSQPATVASPQTKMRNQVIVLSALLGMLILVPLIWFALQGITSMNASPTATTQAGQDLQPGGANEVPLLSASAANAAISADPSNPMNYLALFKAETNDRRIMQAMDAFMRGWDYAEDRSAYIGAAIEAAIDVNHPEVGMIIYKEAFIRADDALALREEIGRRFYDMAVISPVLVRDFYSRQQADLESRPFSPVGFAMYARLFINVGELESAQTALELAMSEVPDLPEARLILGEFYAEQDRLDEARALWEGLLNGEQIPTWVSQRAQELLNQQPV